MNCKQIQLLIESYVDGVLGMPEQDQVTEHLLRCNTCAERHRQQEFFLFCISKVPAQCPPAGFKKRAFAHAKNMHEGYSRGFKYGAFTGTFAAVALMSLSLWMVLPEKLTQTAQTKPSEQWALLKMGMNEARLIQLIFDSPIDIDQATIALDLPTDITLSNVPELNIPGSRTVSWNVNIKKGKNRLRLPVHARGHRGGRVVAELQHKNTKKVFIINVEIDQQNVINNQQETTQQFIQEI